MLTAYCSLPTILTLLSNGKFRLEWQGLDEENPLPSPMCFWFGV